MQSYENVHQSIIIHKEKKKIVVSLFTESVLKEILPIYYVATQKNMYVFNSHVICSNNLNTWLKEIILKSNLMESFVQNNDLCSILSLFIYHKFCIQIYIYIYILLIKRIYKKFMLNPKIKRYGKVK